MFESHHQPHSYELRNITNDGVLCPSAWKDFNDSSGEKAKKVTNRIYLRIIKTLLTLPENLSKPRIFQFSTTKTIVEKISFQKWF